MRCLLLAMFVVACTDQSPVTQLETWELEDPATPLVHASITFASTGEFVHNETDTSGHATFRPGQHLWTGPFRDDTTYSMLVMTAPADTWFSKRVAAEDVMLLARGGRAERYLRKP